MAKLSDDQTIAANTNHLMWLESYTRNKPELLVAGVDVLCALTYELIQIFNNQWLVENLHE